MIAREAECCEASLPAASLEGVLLRVIIRPLIDVPLERRALLDAMLAERIVPRRDVIFIRIPAHPVRARIPGCIGL
jgi:hypothetical protein